VFGMTEPEWPGYPVGSKNTVFAVGVIGLVYNRLEIVLRMVFEAVTEIPQTQARILFAKIQNDVRRSLIEEMIQRRSLDTCLVDRVNAFNKGFKILADNRHAVMHSHSVVYYWQVGTTSDDATLPLAKFSKTDGKVLSCLASVNDLRRVANEMQTYVNFGVALADNIPDIFDPTGRGRKTLGHALPDIPAPPTPLEFRPQAFYPTP
jgi:hypothetical protein